MGKEELGQILVYIFKLNTFVSTNFNPKCSFIFIHSVIHFWKSAYRKKENQKLC